MKRIAAGFLKERARKIVGSHTTGRPSINNNPAFTVDFSTQSIFRRRINIVNPFTTSNKNVENQCYILTSKNVKFVGNVIILCII